MSPSWVDHGAAAQAKWHYPLSCQILSSVETLHTLAWHSRRRGDLTQSLNAPLFPCTWHISPLQQLDPWCSFLFSFPIALLCLQQMPHQFVAFVMVSRDAGINLRNTGQLLWQPCPPQTMIFNILRIFCRLQGDKAEEKNYFKVRLLPKGITISHRALSSQKDDDVDVLSKKKKPWLSEQRQRQGAMGKGIWNLCLYHLFYRRMELQINRLTSFYCVYSQCFLIRQRCGKTNPLFRII